MTPDSSPFQAATILRNLGKIRGLLSLTHGEGNAEEALAACRAALDIHRIETSPHEHREAADILGTIYFGLAQWREAAEAFSSALRAGELLYQAGATPESRNAELREGGDLASRAAYCFARLGRLEDAVETLERSRARALSEALALDDARLEGAREEHRKAFREVREQIRTLEAEARDADADAARSFLTISSELHAARTRLAELLQEIRGEIPDFFEEGLGFAGICQLATALKRPLVQLLTTARGSLALVVPPGAKAPGDARAVWLDRLRQDDLERLLFRGEHSLFASEEAGSASVKAALDVICPILVEDLMSPLAESLRSQGFQQAVLCPAGLLNLLPLHAVVDDRVLLTLAPSARLLQAAVARSCERRSLQHVFLGVGTGVSGQPLPFAAAEIDAAAARFPAERRRLQGEGARRNAVFEDMAGASHLHFACHGTFDPAEPLQSALHLPRGDRITLRDVLDKSPDLSAARLAVLSACRSGLAEYRNTPDEALGFPAVLLQAGIPAVIGTLWPVADVSSALLMSRFYEIHLQEGQPVGEALRSAQGWLRQATAAELGLADRAEELLARARTSAGRASAYQILRRSRARPDLCPYAHPYYWAGYFLSGDPGRETHS
jgi:CHAT domain-containing protein